MARWIKRLVRSTVTVHTRDGRSVRGVLVGEYHDALVLAHAAYLSSDGAQNLLGEVGIPRDNVAWMQATPPEPIP